MIKRNMGLGGALFAIAVILMLVGGYIANVVKIFASFNDPITAGLLIRGVGVFVPPLGAIAGYF